MCYTMVTVSRAVVYLWHQQTHFVVTGQNETGIKLCVNSMVF